MAVFRRASWPVVASLAIVALALAGAISAMGVRAIVSLVRSRSEIGSAQLALSPDELRVEGPSPLWGALTVHSAGSEGTQSGVGVSLRVVKGGEYLDRVTFSGAMEGELWDVAGTGPTHYLPLDRVPAGTGIAIPFRAEMQSGWEAAGPETEVRMLWALVLDGKQTAADAAGRVDAYVTFRRGQAAPLRATTAASVPSLSSAPGSASTEAPREQPAVAVLLRALRRPARPVRAPGRGNHGASAHCDAAPYRDRHPRAARVAHSYPQVP